MASPGEAPALGANPPSSSSSSSASSPLPSETSTAASPPPSSSLGPPPFSDDFPPLQTVPTTTAPPLAAPPPSSTATTPPSLPPPLLLTPSAPAIIPLPGGLPLLPPEVADPPPAPDLPSTPPPASPPPFSDSPSSGSPALPPPAPPSSPGSDSPTPPSAPDQPPSPIPDTPSSPTPANPVLAPPADPSSPTPANPSPLPPDDPSSPTPVIPSPLPPADPSSPTPANPSSSPPANPSPTPANPSPSPPASPSSPTPANPSPSPTGIPSSPTPGNPSSSPPATPSPTPANPAPWTPATPSPTPADPFSSPPVTPSPTPTRQSPSPPAIPSSTPVNPSPSSPASPFPTPATPSSPPPATSSSPARANPSPSTSATPSPTPANPSLPPPASPFSPTPAVPSPAPPASTSPSSANRSPSSPANPSGPSPPASTSTPTPANPSPSSPPASSSETPASPASPAIPTPSTPADLSSPTPANPGDGDPSPPKETHPLPQTSPPYPTLSSPSSTSTSSVINGSFPALPMISSTPADLHPSNDPIFTPASHLPETTFLTGRSTTAKSGTAAGIAIIITLVVLGVAGVLVWSVRKWRKQSGFATGYVRPSPFNSSRMSESPCPGSPTALAKKTAQSFGFQRLESNGLPHSTSSFSYDELLRATDGFSPENLLGEGGFGSVYKGRLPEGKAVAVKQLRVESGRAERDFHAEIEIISRVHHRHLVSLVGCCISGDLRLLVYDYVPNMTLHHHLHEKGRPVMDWATRMKIALGAARGIAYLHEDCHPQIIHRDIKSSNILLDENFEARVSDFGLAKLSMDTSTHVTTRLVGTFGYLAPEYVSSGKLSAKSDVFSFGVVILELLTGRESVDSSRSVGHESLVEWARPLLGHTLETGELGDLPDPKLEKRYRPSEARRLIEVAASCIRHSAPMRPQMGQVVRALDSLDEPVDLSNGVRPGQSKLLGSSWPSAEIRLFQQMAFGGQDHSSSFC